MWVPPILELLKGKVDFCKQNVRKRRLNLVEIST